MPHGMEADERAVFIKDEKARQLLKALVSVDGHFGVDARGGVEGRRGRRRRHFRRRAYRRGRGRGGESGGGGRGGEGGGGGGREIARRRGQNHAILHR